MKIMKKQYSFSILLTIILLLNVTACSNSGGDYSQDNTDTQTPSGDVLTAEKQSALTPEQILESLKEGNQRFVNNNLTPRDFQAQVSQTSTGQYPEAVVISCIDSRVPVEHVFDKGIGDIFVARVAGNFVNEDILGSTEFATAVAGSKVILVMGHEQCGAVKSAIDNVEMGNITAMLSKIMPAVDQTRESFEGDASNNNPEFVDLVIENNVEYTINKMRAESPIIADLERKGEVMIVGAYYDLDTGVVTFLEE